MGKDIIMEERGVAESLAKMARQIVRQHPAPLDVVLVGIRTGGAVLAARLKNEIARLADPSPPVGILDITLYRDDWTRIGPTPVVEKTDIPFSVTDRTVILVDDVLFTGRTVRAAMDALIDFGRPKRIELAILVDRGPGDRELPIAPNYVGAVQATSPSQTINVYLRELGTPDHVTVEEKRAA